MPVVPSQEPGVVRFLTISDPHFSAHNPSTWKVDYWEHTKDVHRRLLMFAAERRVDAVLWAGDLFHLKAPSRNPLWFIAETIRLMESPPLLHLGIAGNHDLKFGSLEGLKGQPIELLVAARCFQLLDYEDYLIQGDDFTVKVAGRSYTHSQAEPLRAIAKGDATWLVALGHFWFGQLSGQFFGEPVWGPDFLSKADADVMVIGHHHEDQGVQRIGRQTYVVAGSSNRTGAHHHDLERRPSATLLEITRGEVKATVVRPSFMDAAQSLDLEARASALAERKEMEEFLAKLDGSAFVSINPRDVLEGMEAVSHDVRRRALAYLEAAETESDAVSGSGGRD